MSFKPKTIKQRIIHRLKIAHGQLEKVIAMAETDAYCIDLIHQSQAIQKALKQIDLIIMENHLQTCVTDSIATGNSQSAIAEVMQVFHKKA